MQIAGIEPESFVDGPGARFVIFVQGCNHRCKGCHNPETWSYTDGADLSLEFLVADIERFFKKNPLLKGLTISGGEPMDKAKELDELLTEVLPIVKNVYCYSGYTLEELVAKNDEDINNVLHKIDYLVDGEFNVDKKCLHELYKGSSNQRIIDMRKYFESGVIEELNTECSDELF